MEFFEFFNTALIVLQEFLTVGAEDNIDTIAARLTTMFWASLAAGLAIYLVFLILGGIGLNKMAVKEGKKRSFLAFLPFFNTWFAGKIAGETSLFGIKMKRAGLYAAIVEGFYTLINAVYVFTTYLTFLYPRLELDELGYYYIDIDVGKVPTSLRWLFGQGEIWVYVFQFMFSLAAFVFLWAIFVALFRKYYARSPVLMTFLCAILPFRGAALFAVRNNKPVDYNTYLRQRFEAARRQQYGPYGPNGGYGQGGGPNPYGPYGDQQRPEEPFSDFGGSNGNDGGNTPPPGSDDPFSDF